MAEDQDYNELLNQNVDEVKSSIRDLENPDYRQILQLEKDGKDRKTVKEFLNSQIEEVDGEQSEDDSLEEETEEIVEEIEEETSEGPLGSFSRSTVLASGVVLGVLIGLVVGYGALGNTGSNMAGQAEIESSVNKLFTASGVNASQLEIADYSKENGMHYVTINVTQQVQNKTQTSSRSYYVSPDGELLFPELQSRLVQTPINIEETLQQLQAQTSNQTAQ